MSRQHNGPFLTVLGQRDPAMPPTRTPRCARMIGLTLVGVAAFTAGFGITTATTAGAPRQQAVTSETCTVQPRRDEDLIAVALAPEGIARALAGETPVPTPEPPAPGEPADSELVASVEATARQLVACYNAGDLRRLFALYSEDYLYKVWGGFAGPNPSRAQIREAVAFLSRPSPGHEPVSLISVQDVQELPDGRVMAVVNLNAGSLLAVFQYSDGWYQLDWAYLLS